MSNHIMVLLVPLFFWIFVREIKIKRRAATALGDLAANAQWKLKFVEEGGLRACVSLARDDDIDLQCLALAALRHLPLNDRIKHKIVEEAALQLLIAAVCDRKW